MNKQNQKGFTLIELLVVIAIIGILSGIVLASLGTARNKANDAKVKSQLANYRAAAELIYANGNYGVAVADNACSVALAGIAIYTATNWPSGVSPVCASDALSAAGINKWSLSQVLSDASSWCVDSGGLSVAGTDADTNGICG